MRVRDAVIVGLALFALVGLWSLEGTVSVTYAFTAPIMSVGHHRYLPQPIVADIDGDGINEIVCATHPDKIGVVRPGKLRGHVAASLAPAQETSFYSNVIGLASGYLAFPNVSVSEAATTGLWFGGNTKKRHALQGHAQHIAVVTDDFRLTMFDCKLHELWSVLIVESDYMNNVPRHAAVSVLPDAVFEHDTGMVVVSLPTVSPTGASETTVAAFSGNSGELRWRHVTKSSASALDQSDAEVLRFKLSEKDLADHSEAPWTRFREAVIASMPHKFSHPWDHRHVPYRFVHTKNARKSIAGKPSGSNRPKEYHRTRSQIRHDEHGDLGQRYASALHGGGEAKGGGRSQFVRPLPNAFVVHSSNAVEYIHLFTGRTITVVTPLKPNVVYDDVNDDLVLDATFNNIGANQARFGRHGVDETFTCRGEVQEGVPGSSRLLATATICDSEGYVSSLGLIRHVVRGDADELVAQHIDPLERIGSRNVANEDTEAAVPLVVHVRKPIGRHIYKSHRIAVFYVSHGIVTAMDPRTGAVLWRSETPSSFSLRAKDHIGDEAFGTFAAATVDEKSSQLHHMPHLVAYSFHDAYSDSADVRSVKAARHKHQPLIVAVGTSHVTLVNSFHGTVEATAMIDRLPIAPTVVADVDSDGVNDLLITTASGYHGYIVRRHASGSATAAILAIAVAIAALMYLSQHGAALDVFSNTGGVTADSDEGSDDGVVLGRERAGAEGGLRRRVTKRSTD